MGLGKLASVSFVLLPKVGWLLLLAICTTLKVCLPGLIVKILTNPKAFEHVK